MKVLHLPTTVGGNPQGLSLHLNLLGVQSQTWSYDQNYLSYSVDQILFAPGDKILVRECKRLLALRYVFLADVIFLNFGSTLYTPFVITDTRPRSWVGKKLLKVHQQYVSFMQQIELLLLRLLKRVIFIQYQGDDARQGDFCRANFEISVANGVEMWYYSPESDALKREQIKLLTNRASKIYALNPDLLHVLPPGSEFLPYSHISLSDWTPVYTQMEERPLRIGHAPTHRGVKGSDLIMDAVQNLKQEGLQFEFVLIEGISNQEAKEIYTTIDVLIDQLYAGWYGGVAVEAMALGKPVLAYIREKDLDFLPQQMRDELPVINVTPDTIESKLRHILNMPRYELLQLAQRSRSYVEHWHDPITIAQRVKADIENAMLEVKK